MSEGDVLQAIDPDYLGLEVVTWLQHGEVMARCPWHGGTSLTVSLTRGLYFCFSCSQAGPIEDLADKLGGVVVRRTIQVKHNVEEHEGWQQLLTLPLALGDPYLAERRVVDTQVRQHQLRRHERGVIIPLPAYDGHPVGVLLRQVGQHRGPKYLLLGQRPLLWPLTELRRYASQANLDERGRYLVLTEGVFGAMSAERAGYRGLALLGAGFHRDVSSYLASRSEQLLLCLDPDPAGYAGAYRLLRELPLALAWCPALEADELAPADWQYALSRLDAGWTRRLEDLLKVTPKPEELLKVMQRLARHRYDRS